MRVGARSRHHREETNGGGGVDGHTAPLLSAAGSVVVAAVDDVLVTRHGMWLRIEARNLSIEIAYLSSNSLESMRL